MIHKIQACLLTCIGILLLMIFSTLPPTMSAATQPQPINQADDITITPSPTLNTAPTLAEPNPIDTVSTPQPLEPIRHIIQPEDTFWYIVQLYGHRFDPSNDVLINEILAINDNFSNIDILPGAGSELLIPQPTVTPSAVQPDTSVSDSEPADNTVEENVTEPTVDPNSPISYIITEGDTLFGILTRFNYTYNIGLVNRVIALNPSIPNADSLPGVGIEILLPQKTATPVPEGLELTQTVAAEVGIEIREGGVTVPRGTDFGCYTVAEGDTIVGIAEQYNTTLEIISQLNQDLNWGGCDFTEYSGGPDCAPILRLDACINVPLPTVTPEPTLTPSGSETPTPTPTYIPPNVIYPPNGAIAPPTTFNLQWVSVGILDADDVYLVELFDTSSSQQWTRVTRNTSIHLDDFLIPSDGQNHSIQWRVSVARPNPSGSYVHIGTIGTWQLFEWQSR